MTTSSMPLIDPSGIESKQVVVLGGTLCVPLTLMIKVNTLLKVAATFCQGLFCFGNHEYNPRMHLRCTNINGLKL
jgi:hypothetical protein